MGVPTDTMRPDPVSFALTMAIEDLFLAAAGLDVFALIVYNVSQ